MVRQAGLSPYIDLAEVNPQGGYRMNPHSIFLMYWLSQTLLSGVRLGLFDQLDRGPQTSAQVAQALRLDPAAAERLLRALAAMGFLQQQAQRYSLTPVSQSTLVSTSPTFSGGIADHHAEQLWPLWTHLPTAVREGRPVLKEAFGGDRNPFDLLTASPAMMVKFLRGMHAGALGSGEALAQAHDFTRHRNVLDIGGGSGAIAGPLLRRYPHLRVTVLDLPQVCAVVPQMTQHYGVADRLGVHPGDFFRPESFPRGYDAAVLSRVLHDWSDEKAMAILRATHAALPPGGTVLVMETLLDAGDQWGRLFAALQDLCMLVLTDGGRERTAAEYGALLALAGFAPAGVAQAGGAMAVVKGVKV